MADKKKAGIAVAVVATIATVGAVALAAKKKPPEEGEGPPEGAISLSVKVLGKPEGVQGYPQEWGVGATLDLNAVCTRGYPAPSMVIELYDNGVLRKTTTIATVTFGTIYTLSETLGVADVGDHVVYGRMVLTNPLGDWEFTTAPTSFSIGEAPPGEITLDITLIPP